MNSDSRIVRRSLVLPPISIGSVIWFEETVLGGVSGALAPRGVLRARDPPRIASLKKSVRQNFKIYISSTLVSYCGVTIKVDKLLLLEGGIISVPNVVSSLRF